MTSGVAASKLIASAKAGDRDAIASLLALAHPDIRRYARYACRADDIDDAVQDALTLVVRHIGALRRAAVFSAWTFQIVKRECLRLARMGRRLAQRRPLEEIENTLTFATMPEPELRADLAAALEALPTHYRDMIMLRDIEELTIAEIGTTLGITNQAVKARLHRARLMVREYLEQ